MGIRGEGPYAGCPRWGPCIVSDERLRAELESLEHSAPSGPYPEVRSRPPLPLMGLTVLAAALTAAILFARLPDRGMLPAYGSGEVSAEARYGDFLLTVSSPQSRWQSDEVVTVSAVLTYEGASDGTWISNAAQPVSMRIEHEGSDESYTTVMAVPFACDPLREAYRFEDDWSHRASQLATGQWRVVASADFGLHAAATSLEDCSDGESAFIASIEFEIVPDNTVETATETPAPVGNAEPISLSNPTSAEAKAMGACFLPDWQAGLTGAARIPISDVLRYVPLTGREPEINRAVDRYVWVFEYRWRLDVAPIIPTRGTPTSIKSDHLVCMVVDEVHILFIVGVEADQEGTIISTPHPGASPDLALPTPAP